MDSFLKKIKNIRNVHTYFCFPVDSSTDKTTEGKRGVAMIIAIVVVTIMLLFSADLILSSQVNLQLATAQRDNLKAEYMAKSSLNTALLLLSSDFAFDLFQAQQNPKKGGLQDGKGDFWSMLNGFPIGGESADMLEGFQESMGLSSVLDKGIISQLRLFDGSFVVNVEDEGKKINVNFCHRTRCTETLMMLESLFSCPAEKVFLEKKDIDPKELAYKIKDWVDHDSKAESASGASDEDDPYSRRAPKVRAKNAPFDSVDELRNIDGWDDEVHEVFSDYITVWPLQKKNTEKYKINLNTASRSLLGCVFPESRGDCNDKSTLALMARNKDRTSLGASGQDVKDVLKKTMCYTGGGSKDDDAANRANWFKMSSMVFSIKAKGQVNDQEKTLHAIVERRMPDVKKGEKSSYKILYWRMM
jgi:type II secretory pathway component PulK